MPKPYDWRMLPDLFFSDVMLMVGLQSLESLHRCRQVIVIIMIIDNNKVLITGVQDLE